MKPEIPPSDPGSHNYLASTQQLYEVTPTMMHFGMYFKSCGLLFVPPVERIQKCHTILHVCIEISEHVTEERIHSLLG